MNKILILLGAGASSEYFPSTSELTSTLLEDIFFKNIKDKANADFSNDYLNFERLIEIGKVISSVHAAQKNKKDMHESFIPLLKPFIELRDFPLDSLENDPALLYKTCGKILDRMASPKSRTSLNEIGKDGLNTFIVSLSQANIGINLFSLNYDALPTYSNVPFETGFYLKESEAYGFSNSFKFLTSLEQNIFVQLHGSTLFGYPPERKGGIVRFVTSELAKQSRDATFRGTSSDSSGLQKLHDLMITGSAKAEMILDEPFASYFHRFYTDLVSTSNWLLIGYGFGDFHVNSFLQRAREAQIQEGRKVRIARIEIPPEPFASFRQNFFPEDPGKKEL